MRRINQVPTPTEQANVIFRHDHFVALKRAVNEVREQSGKVVSLSFILDDILEKTNMAKVVARLSKGGKSVSYDQKRRGA